MQRSSLVLVTDPTGRAAVPFHTADASAPQLSVFDSAVTRGDGVFETVAIFDGRVSGLDAHLGRFARSAALLDLPAPSPETWRSACAAALDAMEPVPEATLRLVLTRGTGDGVPSAWVVAAASADHTIARTEGVRVSLLNRGIPRESPADARWLLAGAKTLSYAVNAAAQREAARRGADDAIFVSSDGYVLEGPTSSVVYRVGNRFGTPETGATLAGTTQFAVFTWARRQGFETGTDLITPDQLRGVDAAWLVSSGRLAAPIREIDGQAHPVDTTVTPAVNAWLRRGDGPE